MKAIVAKSAANGDDYEPILKEEEVEKPVAKGRDLLISVKAVATNPIDTKVLGGHPIARAPSENNPVIVGFDGAGVVESIGEEVKNFKVGDEVYFAGSLIRAGCFADYVLIDERISALKPKNLSFAEAASLPLTTLTTWESYAKLMNIPIPNTEAEKEENRKKVILIVGAAGGVGSIATQIAKYVFHLTVISTASRDDSIAWAKANGSDFVVNHRFPLPQQIRELGFNGVHYIFCCSDLTANYYSQFIDISLPFAKIAFIIANDESVVNLRDLMYKSITLTAELMFTRPIFMDDIDYQHEVLSIVADLLEKNVLRATKNYEFSYSVPNFVEALKLQLSGKAIGKIVLSKE